MHYKKETSGFTGTGLNRILVWIVKICWWSAYEWIIGV